MTQKELKCWKHLVSTWWENKTAFVLKGKEHSHIINLRQGPTLSTLLHQAVLRGRVKIASLPAGVAFEEWNENTAWPQVTMATKRREVRTGTINFCFKPFQSRPSPSTNTHQQFNCNSALTTSKTILLRQVIVRLPLDFSRDTKNRWTNSPYQKTLIL